MSAEYFRINHERRETIEDDPWDHLYNPIIMDVFSEYSNSNSGFLFGVTGDLDNLGVYVARNGRPAAENLVDFYNQVTRNYLKKWGQVNEGELESLSFTPSGEEVLVLGVSKSPEVCYQLFSNIRQNVMNIASSQHFIALGDTAASFGGKIFGREYDNNIKNMVNDASNKKGDEVVFPQYLSIVANLRNEMAVELDKQKFHDLLDGQHPVAMRQLVLTRMLQYKRSTHEILRSLKDLNIDDRKLLITLLGDNYGIPEEIEDQIDIIVRGLMENKNE